MNNDQKINLFFDGFDAEFNKKIPVVISETAVEFFQDTFKSKSWDNVAWPVFNANGKNNQVEPTRGSLMLRTLALFDSIKESELTESKVTISAGSAIAPYARVHNEGLQVAGIRNVKSYTNKNFMGKGKPVAIKAHTRAVNFKMPKRQFIGPSILLNTEINQRLARAWNSKNK
jgi:hypothetical protein